MKRFMPLFALLLTAVANLRSAEEVIWRKWSPEVFAEAKRDHKFVLLDLEAVWCHWCHVMEHETYSNPEVIKFFNQSYIAVRVDQDSRPDLANRYEDYGWPATVVYGFNGEEIVKRRGYIPPDDMRSMLQAIIDDPTPGPSIVAEKELKLPSDATVSKEKLGIWKKRIIETYDSKIGGWGVTHKYLDWDNVEYSLCEGLAGDVSFDKIAKDMLVLQRKIIDPTWGGVYQYSAEGDWDHPHFEKIMSIQAENIRIYARAYRHWKNPDDLATAQSIYDYLRTFLTSPEGVVYTSQDADLVQGEHSADYFALNDASRRKQGVPRVDQHSYARENGWIISALVDLYAATGNKKYLREATHAAEWVIKNRSLPKGGFRHDGQDKGGPYLGDSVAMGRAFVALYTATGDRVWLAKAEAALGFINTHFPASSAGWATADTTVNEWPSPKPQYDENVAVARLAVALANYTGNKSYRGVAESALRWLAADQIVDEHQGFIGGLLLAENEFNGEPLHVVVLGSKNDPAAEALFVTALNFPAPYRQLEWYDRKEGPLPGNAIEYPDLDEPAAFVCANGACSRPITNPAVLSPLLSKRLVP